MGRHSEWTGTRQVCNAYGITETGSWVAGLDDADVTAEDGLIGKGWGAVIQILRTGDTTQPLLDEHRLRPASPAMSGSIPLPL